jgi:hypothetical protein
MSLLGTHLAPAGKPTIAHRIEAPSGSARYWPNVQYWSRQLTGCKFHLRPLSLRQKMRSLSAIACVG